MLKKVRPKFFYGIEIAGHISLGCIFNKRCSPLSYLYEKDGLTTAKCVKHCKENRYAYAGFDHCRKCFCGDNVMTYAKTTLGNCRAKRRSRCRHIKSGCEASSHIEIFRTSKITIISYPDPTSISLAVGGLGTRPRYQ